MKPRDVTRRFHIYTDFWLGLASAGAQGLADVASALKEERENDHSLDSAVAVGMKAVLDAASEAMNKVATGAEHVKDEVERERKRAEREKQAARDKEIKDAVAKARGRAAAQNIQDNAEIQQPPVEPSGQ
jgi:hypothetical protein